MSEDELLHALADFTDTDGCIPLPIVDQNGKQIGIARRTPDELQTVEAFVDEHGTAWLAPTAWAYYAVCKARDAALKQPDEAAVLRVARAIHDADKSDEADSSALPRLFEWIKDYRMQQARAAIAALQADTPTAEG